MVIVATFFPRNSWAFFNFQKQGTIDYCQRKISRERKEKKRFVQERESKGAEGRHVWKARAVGLRLSTEKDFDIDAWNIQWRIHCCKRKAENRNSRGGAKCA